MVVAAIALIATMFGCASLPGNKDEKTVDVSLMRQSVVAIQGAGLGSGVIISEDGYIVTNNHVVEGCAVVEVWYLNNMHRAFNTKGKVVFCWEDGDLAVVKIDPPEVPLVVAKFGDSSLMREGDTVYAIGHPYGIVWTASKGIVGAIRYMENGFPVLQHDAMLGPGNSGGLLMNERGELVGINFAAIAIQVGWGPPISLGIGYALASNVVRVVVEGVIAWDKELGKGLKALEDIINS